MASKMTECRVLNVPRRLSCPDNRTGMPSTNNDPNASALKVAAALGQLQAKCVPGGPEPVAAEPAKTPEAAAPPEAPKAPKPTAKH